MLMSTGQGVIGCNMFCYCGNNPINRVDPTGMWTVNLSIGGDATFFFFGASISIGIAFDDDFNIAVQWSHSSPINLNNDQTFNVGLFDAGVGGALQITNDDTIYNLEGMGGYAGFTAGNGLYGGVDMVYSDIEIMDERAAETLPKGIQFSIGCGVGLDAHLRRTETHTMWKVK